MAKQSAMERAKAKLKQMQERAKGGGGEFPFDFMSLVEGKNIVRIFKTWRDDEEADFYKECEYHNGLGPENKSMQCPGDDCPVCAEAQKIKSKAKALKSAGKKDEADKKYNEAREISARKKIYFNAIKLTLDGPVQSKKGVEGKPATKPEVLSCGAMVLSGILSYFTEDEAKPCGPFWEDGSRYDFLIKKIKTGPKDIDVKYEVKALEKYAEVDTSELEEKLHDLDELFDTKPTLAAIKAAFEGVEYNEEEDEEKDEEEEEVEEKDDEEDEEEDSEEDDSDGEDEEDEEEKKKGKDDDEEDDEEDSEDEDEEEKDEDDEEEGEDDEDDEEEKKEEDEDDSEDDEEKEADKEKPICFGDKDDHNPKDSTCKKCPWFKKCAAEVGGKKPAEDEEDEDKPAKKKSKVGEKMKKALKKHKK